MSLETSGDTKDVTFAEAFATPETASPTVEPASTGEPILPTPESATTSQVDPTKDAEQPREPVGPIPVDRHKALLEAERKRTDEFKTKWERVQWASELADQGATPEAVRRALSISRELSERPDRVIEGLLTEAQDYPELLAQVRSIAGRILGNGHAVAGNGQPPAASEDLEPQPDMFDSATGIQGYSAAQQRKWGEWRERAILAKIAEDNKPIREWWQSQQTRERQQAQAQAFNGQVQSHIETQGKRLDALVDIGTKAGYYDDSFKAKMSEYAKSKNFDVTIDEVWNHVLHTHVLPTFGQRERSRYDAELRTQAAASSVNPKAGAVSVPANITRLDDPRLWKT